MPRFRPRPTFSLSTMLVLTAVLGIWLAYHLKWIQERRDERVHIAYFGYSSDPGDTRVLCDPVPAPWPIRYFGESGVAQIVISNRWATDERMARLRELFPEAKVGLPPPDLDWRRAQPLPPLSTRPPSNSR